MKMYCYKKCSTCKKAAAFLRERGSSFEEIDYTEQPLSTEQLRAYWQTSHRERPVLREVHRWRLFR